MSEQRRARMVTRAHTGGGQDGQASIYQLILQDGEVLLCDYIEIASDGFRTFLEGEEAWCTRSPDRRDWATYVIPIREFSPLELLGIAPQEDDEADPLTQLWF
ncbi:MAG: hypothetical protein LBK95_11090 [Bifidobacteriaceae bacterium]|jgi:hypothetical protein|nr:hypothetical protein [Bifidobacteriaceae bacterium]